MFVLFVKLTAISTSMDVLRECVLIVPPHNSAFSFSVGLLPRIPTRTLVHLSRAPKQCRAAVLLQRATVGQSPGGGVFSDKSLPNLVPALNCFFVISSMWMSVWLSCGSMDSLCSDTLHGFHQDIDSASPSTTTAAPSSSNHCFPIEWNLFFSLSHEAWNTSFYIGIDRYLNFWSDPGCAH